MGLRGGRGIEDWGSGIGGGRGGRGDLNPGTANSLGSFVAGKVITKWRQTMLGRKCFTKTFYKNTFPHGILNKTTAATQPFLSKHHPVLRRSNVESGTPFPFFRTNQSARSLQERQQPWHENENPALASLCLYNECSSYCLRIQINFTTQNLNPKSWIHQEGS